jgi:molybdopterin-guanine dinucleotide biosynthesis protein A
MRSEPVVVILAGGEASRIGGAKPLRMLGGERLIDHALRHAREWSNLVAVSVRNPEQVQPIEATVIRDEPEVVGPLAGLISALRFACASGLEFALVIAADMPFLPADLPERLLAAIGPRACALASSGGQLHPVCGLWRTGALREIQPYIENGRRSLKGLAETIGFVAVEWTAGAADPFFNINTVEDLARAQQRF